MIKNKHEIRMMNKLFAFFFVLFSVSLTSQSILYLKDSMSNEPSPFVMVLNEKSEIIGTSNELGEVDLDSISTLSNKIFLVNIFYKKKEVEIDKIKEDKTILLTPIVNLLEEVEIVPKNYIVLTAYNRIYNLSDDVLISFVDAEVKYIIKGKRIKKKVLNHRIFDLTPSNEYREQGKNPYWVSDLKSTILFEHLHFKFNLVKDEEKGGVMILDNDGKLLSDAITVAVNSKKGANIKIESLKRSKNFNGIKIEEYNNEHLLNVTIEDLKYKSVEKQRKVRDHYIKKNPLLKGKKILFNKREIFIQSVEYISKETYKKIKKMGFKDTSISHYTREFWKGLSNYTPLDSLIELQIKNVLVERK